MQCIYTHNTLTLTHTYTQPHNIHKHNAHIHTRNHTTYTNTTHTHTRTHSGSWNRRYFALVSGACVYVKTLKDFWSGGKMARIQLHLKPEEINQGGRQSECVYVYVRERERVC
jgi:thiaminase